MSLQTAKAVAQSWLYLLVKLLLAGMELIRKVLWPKRMWWQIPVLGHLATPLVNYSVKRQRERCGEYWYMGDCE